MSASRKHVRQPGPADAERIDSYAGPARALDFTLEPGRSVLDAVAAPLERAGLRGAAVAFRRISFKPFRYVIPAYAGDDAHAAYYSNTFAPEEEVVLDYATLTYGQKDGAPFLHCHALWRDRDGRRAGGHLLPSEACVSAPGMAQAFGTEQVAMIARPDAETNFTLFRPEPTGAFRGEPGCILARIKPNVDLIEGIEDIRRRHGFREAIIRSGIGSIIGAEFTDGRRIEERPTEIVVLHGRITSDPDGSRVDMTIGLIDVKGAVHEGHLVRGRNPVLICFELVLELVA